MEDLQKKIESEKYVLENMPRNNKKNISIYIEKLDELIAAYSEIKKEYLDKIVAENKRILDIPESNRIEEIEKQIEGYELIFNSIDDIKGSYEKMELDKDIYRLGKFYREDLEEINLNISNCISKFKRVGIDLTEQDFTYSYLAHDYMVVFLEEYARGNVNSPIVKEQFERTFWKCPDLMIHIKVNFLYLYYKYQPKIDKYFERVKTSTEANLNFPVQELRKLYVEKNAELEQLQINDKAAIINKFYEGEYSVKDFEDDKIQSYYETMLKPEVAKADLDEEFNLNIIKFIDSLKEFKNYTKYKYIIDDFKQKYNDRMNHKTDSAQIKKEIAGKEKQIQKLGNNFNKKILFGKKKQEQKKADFLKIMNELKDDYKRLYMATIYDSILKNVNEDFTLYDVFKFMLCFNNYIVEIILLNNPEIDVSETDRCIKEIKDFIKNPYNTIIKNLTITDEKDVAIIISDRYKLSKFKINKEDITVDNADNIIAVLNKIVVRHIMDKQGIKLNEMQFLVDSKKIIQDNK